MQMNERYFIRKFYSPGLIMKLWYIVFIKHSYLLWKSSRMHCFKRRVYTLITFLIKFSEWYVAIFLSIISCNDIASSYRFLEVIRATFTTAVVEMILLTVKEFLDKTAKNCCYGMWFQLSDTTLLVSLRGSVLFVHNLFSHCDKYMGTTGFLKYSNLNFIRF